MNVREVNMATSRTGTGKWKSIRKRALHRAMRDGITHCTECRIVLDYETGLRPNSAEVDHIIPWSVSQTDTLDGTRVICRRCNQSLGGKQSGRAGHKKAPVETIDFT